LNGANKKVLTVPIKGIKKPENTGCCWQRPAILAPLSSKINRCVAPSGEFFHISKIISMKQGQSNTGENRFIMKV